MVWEVFNTTFPLIRMDANAMCHKLKELRQVFESRYENGTAIQSKAILE